jgi:hypothetical protein
VFQPRSFSPEAEAKYNITCLIPKGSPLEKEVRAEMERVAKATFGDGAVAVLKRQAGDSNRALLKDGDEKLNKDGEPVMPDHMLLKASSKTKPLVVDRNPKNELTEQDGLPYGGCFCNVKLDIWAQNNQFGKWLNAKLLGVQFAGDGDPFGGGGDRARPDDFDDMSGGDAPW